MKCTHADLVLAAPLKKLDRHEQLHGRCSDFKQEQIHLESVNPIATDFIKKVSDHFFAVSESLRFLAKCKSMELAPWSSGSGLQRSLPRHK